MTSVHPSGTTVLILLMGVVASVAVHQVFLRRGLLPICSYCRKVRNDRNYWEQIETYISQHSGAQFSHGICPDCRDGVVKDELERWRGHP